MKRRIVVVCALAVTTALLVAFSIHTTSSDQKRADGIYHDSADISTQQIAHRRSPSQSACSQRLKEGQCGFRGNSDYYGFGIRLGYYLQYAATLVYITWLPGKRKDPALALLAFMLAEFIALFVISFRSACTFEAEVITILYLIGPGMVSMQIYLMSYVSSIGVGFFHFQERVSVSVPALSQIFLNALLGFSFWFWLAMTGAVHNIYEPTPCGTSLFLVAHVQGSNFHKGAIAMAVFTGWLLLCNTPVTVAMVGGILAALFLKLSSQGKEEGLENGPRRRSTAGDRSSQAQGAPERSQATRKSTSSTSSSTLGARALVALVNGLHALLLLWSILAVELQLHWNNISDVYSLASTGQFIPLIIAVFSLLQLPGAMFDLPKRLMGLERDLIDRVLCEFLTDEADQPTTTSRSIPGRASDRELDRIESSAPASGLYLPRTQARPKRQATI